ncbi:MAG: LysM peptidoglycan-binding domain-containing protein [Pontiellaceae bacterium]|nr:LysM peptidoglycan-binding domain-containing protein [Pontiellaceae bacterium]
MKMKMVVLSLVSAVVFSGCQTMQSQRTTQAQNANVTRYVTELERRTNSKLEAMSAENARLQQQVQQLSTELRSINSQVAQLNSNMSALDARQKKEITQLVNEVNAKLRQVGTSSSNSGGSRTTVSGRLHTVESGHTLSTIAQAYGSTVKAIMEANNLKSDVIIVGQKLVIPD